MTTAAEFELVVAARAESVPLVRHALRGLLSTLEVGDARTADIALAVTEACTNVVLHAYANGPGSMEVRAAEREGELAVTVRDRGSGIAPRVDSPGLGVGLPVIAAIADAVAIAAAAGGGTEVTMRFSLRPAAA